jgi:predicted PurR-regulated permease PerM
MNTDSISAENNSTHESTIAASQSNASLNSNRSIAADLAWNKLLRKLAIWGGFLLVMYIARDFFFAAFMTFLICYYTLALVGWGMSLLSPDRERPWLRRLLTIGIFVLVPVILLGAGIMVSPHVVAQGQRLSGWLRYASPETEASRLLEDFMGSSMFATEFGRPGSPSYQKGLEDFYQRGERHSLEYNRFPSLEAWVEGSIFRPFADNEREEMRSSMLSEGVSSKALMDWFVNQKIPELIIDGKREIALQGRSAEEVTPLLRAAATSTPDQLLKFIYRNQSDFEALRQEWIEDTLDKKFDEVQDSAEYQERLRIAFESQRQNASTAIPFSFEEYLQLSKIRQQGRRAFGEVFEKLRPPPADEDAASRERRLRQDFEAAMKHDLFQKWWKSNSIAKFIRHHLQTLGNPDAASGWIERIVISLLNVPLDLATAFTLSLFICIDFTNLKKSMPMLRQTWLREVYDEVAPAASDMGHLIGRFMQLQGMIALISATLTSIGLWFLGVEHVMVLGIATFLLCLVPTVGGIFAIALIVVFSLFQYGGGLGLAIEAGLFAGVVSLIESFVTSPRILGQKMDLHPVLLVTVLPLAQYFFGIWGLILATPVAVYVLHVLVLERGLPGAIDRSKKSNLEVSPPEPTL